MFAFSDVDTQYCSIALTEPSTLIIPSLSQYTCPRDTSDISLKTTLDYLVNGEDESSEKAKILAREANNLTDVQLDLIRSMIKEFEKKNKE